MGERLIEDLSPSLKASVAPPILVLDDYHRIQNPLIHESVSFLIQFLPSPLHVILLTREDPPLPLARWRVQNQMTEIRARDLRFSADEATEFLNRMMALDLPADKVSLLEKRTEGWIAGLQLAALSLQDQADAEHFVQRFAGDDRQVVDYLASEVLAHQPEDVQRFLLHTSILERMCADLCTAVLSATVLAPNAPTSSPQSPITNHQSLLEALDRRNLFLVPLDNRRHWYRYHHLFGELLRHHLHATADVATVHELHRRAARWYAAHDQPVDAVAHALAAEDADFAAELIEAALASGDTWSSGEVGTWQAWWRALPADALHSRPWLSLRISRALYLAGHIDEAERLLDEVEETLHARPAQVGDTAGLLAQATVYRAAVAAMRGEIRQAIQDAHRALNRLPEHETLVRARAFDTLGMAYELRGELGEANWAYHEASLLAERAGVLYLVINARCEAAMVQIAQGQLQRAHQTCQSAIESLPPDDADLPPLGLAWSVIGEILRQQNKLDEAATSLRRGMQLSQQGGITDDLRYEYLFLSRLCLSQGDFTGGLAALQQVDLLLQGYHVQRLSDLAAAHRVRIWLAQGQHELALRWAEDYAQAAPTEYLREFEDLTLARVWLASGGAPEAADLLERIVAAAETGGRMGVVAEGMALLALTRHAQDDHTAALNALARPLAVRATGRCARLPRRRPAHAAPAQPRRRREDRPRLHRTNLKPGQPRSHRPRSHRAGPCCPPVTRRTASHRTPDRTQIEVLVLLAERLTNAEICQRLVISLPTVKTHTSNIYTKLGVSGRRDAVAQAQALGILG
ncbi:MAG: LuxR C-terminal-related transcriptional regulator [Caldilineaceae bacterium]